MNSTVSGHFCKKCDTYNESAKYPFKCVVCGIMNVENTYSEMFMSSELKQKALHCLIKKEKLNYLEFKIKSLMLEKDNVKKELEQYKLELNAICEEFARIKEKKCDQNFINGTLEELDIPIDIFS